MADVVLVHGIDQQQRSAESLEAEWVPDLAGGIRISGFPQIADLIWRARGGLAEIDTRMAFYGDLFLVAGQQGDDEEELNHEEMILADQIAIEWLERASNRATSVKNRECAVRELSYLHDDIGHEAQGPRELARKAIKSAARFPCFARFEMAFGGDFSEKWRA